MKKVKEFAWGMLRLMAMVGAMAGLKYVFDLESDWKWVLVILNAGALIAVAMIRERSKWSDERVKNWKINISLIIFISIVMAADLVCFLIKWPK